MYKYQQEEEKKSYKKKSVNFLKTQNVFGKYIAIDTQLNESSSIDISQVGDIEEGGGAKILTNSELVPESDSRRSMKIKKGVIKNKV